MGFCSALHNLVTLLLYVAGLGLSGYAYYVEISREKDPNFVALCEISEKMNCTRVLTSEWSKGFGLVEKYLGKDHVLYQPNALYGIVFYSLTGLLHMCGRRNRFIASFLFLCFVASCVMSAYLAYILFVVLEDLCVICVGTYAVNFLLLLLNMCNKGSSKPVKKSYKKDEPIIGNFKKNI